ncbi:MAG: DUF3881 family protein [Acidobacteria bacterium]|nr:DUF3881 family protein [Acidobacteriota bacterium]
MPEPFTAIGFHVNDQAAYEALAAEARLNGAMTQARRDLATLHGCCWELGGGLEVWTILHESQAGVCYADCRPAFRGRQTYELLPWEILEFEEEGEAVVRAQLENTSTEIVFELQNLTEINPAAYRHRTLTAAIAGLAYQARVMQRRLTPRFKQKRRGGYENNYAVRGTVLAWRALRNPRTTSDLYWVQLDIGVLTLELLINRADLTGELANGITLAADIWLQGHILTDHELDARYEGVDRRIPSQAFWLQLRRGN